MNAIPLLPDATFLGFEVKSQELVCNIPSMPILHPLATGIKYHHSDPLNPQAIASLARVSVKLDEDPVRINELLNEVVMSNVGPEWVCWARDLLATKYALSGGNATAFLLPAVHGRTIESNSLPLNFPAPTAEELPVPSVRPEAVVPPLRILEEQLEDGASKVIVAPTPEFSSIFSPERRLPVSSMFDIPSADWSTFPQVPPVQSASFAERIPHQSPPATSNGQ